MNNRSKRSFKKQLQRQMKKLLLLSIAVLISVGFILILTADSVKAETPVNDHIVTIYDSIKISQGETLEDIAIRYNTSGIMSNSAYINEVKRINHIYTDTIHAGCYLTVISYCE